MKFLFWIAIVLLGQTVGVVAQETASIDKPSLIEGFEIESFECQIARPDRFRDENFGIKYPAFRPYGNEFDVTGVFLIKGKWQEGSDRSKRKIKIPIEFEIVPLGLMSSPELLKTLKTEHKFLWERWGIDDHVELLKEMDGKEGKGKPNDARLNGADRKVVRFQSPLEKDFFGSQRKTRGGFRTFQYELEFELPAGREMNEKIPFEFIYMQEKPLIACCYYRIGVKSPSQILTTRAGVLYHGSQFAQQKREFDKIGAELLEEAGLGVEKSDEQNK